MIKHALFLLAFSLSAKAALTLTLFEGVSHSVVLNIEGSGQVGNGQAFFIALGTTGNTFLFDGQHRQAENTFTPTIALGTSPLDEAAYSDLNGAFGFASAVELQFSSAAPPAPGTELSTLDGIYFLNDWVFSDFNPGAYSLTSLGGIPTTVIEVSGSIELVVVPEPKVASLGLIAALLFLSRRRFWFQ